MSGVNLKGTRSGTFRVVPLVQIVNNFVDVSNKDLIPAQMLCLDRCAQFPHSYCQSVDFRGDDLQVQEYDQQCSSLLHCGSTSGAVQTTGQACYAAR